MADEQTQDTAPQADEPKTETPVEKTFKQADVDGIVTDRLNRQATKLKADFEKKLADALTAKDQEFESLVQGRVETALAEKALADAKTAIASEFGLSEAQLARLQGTSADELRADAETVFGPLKKPAPKLPTGDNQKLKASPVDDLEAKVLAGLSKVT